MSDGFLGAIRQFWTVEEKPRLYRRNSWFDDHQVNLRQSNLFWISFTVLAWALVLFMVVKGL